MRKVIYSFAALGLMAGPAYAQSTPPDEGDSVGGQTSTEGAGDSTTDGPVGSPGQPADTGPPTDPSGVLNQSPDGVPDPASQAPVDAADPATTAGADSAYTDEEIDSFAEATVKVQEIDANTSLSAEEKQSQMAAAVTAAGLDSATYNEIGQAIATDPDLRSRVEAAMSRHAAPGEG